MNYILRTSISISKGRKERLEKYLERADTDEAEVLSFLFLKGYRLLCTNARFFVNVQYQNRGEDYEIKTIRVQGCDREYMSACRDLFKLSVSLIFRVAIDYFLDDIEKNGINPDDVAKLRVEKNSYADQWFVIRNLERRSQIQGAFFYFTTKMKRRR